MNTPLIYHGYGMEWVKDGRDYITHYKNRKYRIETKPSQLLKQTPLGWAHEFTLYEEWQVTDTSNFQISTTFYSDPYQKHCSILLRHTERTNGALLDMLPILELMSQRILEVEKLKYIQELK